LIPRTTRIAARSLTWLPPWPSASRFPMASTPRKAGCRKIAIYGRGTTSRETTRSRKARSRFWPRGANQRTGSGLRRR
jgi:hypothetical protein